jgi:hypothetical protein
MKRLFPILASFILLASAALLLCGAQRGMEVILSPAPAGGSNTIASVEYLCRDHAGTAGPITCVSGGSDTTSKAITLGHTTSTNDSIVVLTLGVSDGASSGTLTDNQNQIYTKGTNTYTGLEGTHADYTLWYICNSLSGVTTVTWTPEASDVPSSSAMGLAHYTGIISACHDSSTVWSGTGHASPVTGTSATPANANDLLIGTVWVDGSVGGCSDKTVATTGPWTAEFYMHENGDGGAAGFLDQIVTSSAAYAATASSSATGACMYAGIESLKG